MRTDFTLSIENNHISFGVDGMTQVCRPLTHIELKVIKDGAKYDSMEIFEDDKGQAALLSYFTLELCGKIKYGMDRDLEYFMLQG